MGIKTLLKQLQPIITPCHLSTFSGKRIGVDASCWLHRAAHSCAYELVEGKPTTKYLKFCELLLSLLLHNNTKPIIVFDGRELPQKSGENIKRRNNRSRAKHIAQNLMREGSRQAALEKYQQAVSISSAMVQSFIALLREKSIDFVVAPYEADAQLAYLYGSNAVDYVMSEDSDLLLFGVRKLLLKLDRYGSCQLCNLDILHEIPPDNHNVFTQQLLSLSQQQFIMVCILSGCDYLDSIPGVGLITAMKLMKKHNSVNTIVHCLSQKLLKKGKQISETYIQDFNRAFLTFQHQIVYDIVSKQLVHLQPFDAPPNSDLSYLGAKMSDDIAQNLAKGEIDPSTMKEVSCHPIALGDKQPVFPQYRRAKTASKLSKALLAQPTSKLLMGKHSVSAQDSLQSIRKFFKPLIRSNDEENIDILSPSLEVLSDQSVADPFETDHTKLHSISPEHEVPCFTDDESILDDVSSVHSEDRRTELDELSSSSSSSDERNDVSVTHNNQMKTEAESHSSSIPTSTAMKPFALSDELAISEGECRQRSLTKRSSNTPTKLVANTTLKQRAITSFFGKQRA